MLKRSFLVSLLATALLVGLAGALVYWRISRTGTGTAVRQPLQPAPDPRLVVKSRFLNTQPDVKYVGDKECSGCHRSISEKYHHHPMGQSLFPISAATPIERYDAAAHNPFDAGAFHYSIHRRGDGTVHEASAVGGKIREEHAVAYAVGSGQRGRSYLLERGGFVFESPITWYPLKKIWDLSPGYDRVNSGFSRPITAECLFCHANHVEPDPHTQNSYKPPLFQGFAIGCERCHGPGELHVERRRAGEIEEAVDATIVNPRYLEPPLREAICQQCHLHGEARVLPRGRSHFDFRPGLPLDLFLVDFVKPTDEARSKFVGTVQQMHASQCFKKTVGQDKLGCTSCHDPHGIPSKAERVAFYRERCQTCHEQLPCSLPVASRRAQSPEDSCIACHMPTRQADITHTAITDHTVPRSAKPAPAQKAEDPAVTGLALLMPFGAKRLEENNPDKHRNLGIALLVVARKQHDTGVARTYVERALPLLEKATANDPADTPAWEARAIAYFLADEPGLALTSVLTVLQLEPERETALLLAANITMQLLRPAEAREYATRALKIDPWSWQAYHLVAASLVQERNWERGAVACRESLKLQPVNAPARQLLIRCLLGLGDKNQAKAELDLALALLPESERDAFRRWFEQQRP